MRLLFFLLSLLSLSGMANEYYVQAGASGKQSGTESDPFSTIQQAADIMQPGDACLIGAGVYPESIRPAASGTPDAPVVFKALPGGKVVITGSDPLSPDRWKSYGDNMFRIKVKLDLGHENQVFLGTRMLMEARWPNTEEDLLDPMLSVMDEGTTPEMILDAELPELDWTGAGVWVHAPKYWADWTTYVLAFEKGRIDIENLAPYPGPKQHVAVEGAEYFLYGCLAALDADNEWYYDEQKGYLYVYRPDGKMPDGTYYVKRRMNAFDLKGRKNIRLEGMELNGASISTDRKSRYVVLDGLSIFYPYHSSEANQKYGRQTDKGVLMMGNNCTVRNCEVAYSSGCGIVLDGTYNLVVNCYIHDTDYIGTYASCIKLQGKGNIISHCTLSRTGRSVIDYGEMHKSLIQYCDMSKSGMLTRDTGLTYGNIINGGNSEVRYNWMHDNLDDHWDMGLYYDHGTQNILSHHNVIWGVDHFAFMINHYGYFHQVYNNTFSADTNGFMSVWGNQYGPDLYGCRIVNNIFSTPTKTTTDNYTWAKNIQGYTGMEDHKYLPAGSACIDAGMVIPGITDGYAGGAPDLGAYEDGRPRWKTGHDFDNPPEIDTTRILTIYRNMLENSAFENEDQMISWEASGPVSMQRGRQSHTRPDTNRVRMGSRSVKLGGKSELSQVVGGLLPDSWYEFSGFLRVDEYETVVLGVRNESGIEEHSSSMQGNAPRWNRVLVRFKTAPGQTETIVFARRLTDGRGEAFLDDCGLILIEMDGQTSR